jgi:glycine dehydrogenase
MIEPTESESLQEIDRFIDAMIAIRAEIRAVENGEISHDDSPLAAAPHTLEVVTADDWQRAYTREQAAFPVGYTPAKYWPPVGRIDQAYGDRNLVCSCPDPSAFAEPASDG